LRVSHIWSVLGVYNGGGVKQVNVALCGVVEKQGVPAVVVVTVCFVHNSVDFDLEVA